MAEKECMAAQSADELRATVVAKLLAGQSVPGALMRQAFPDLRALAQWLAEHPPSDLMGRLAAQVLQAVVELEASMGARRVRAD